MEEYVLPYDMQPNDNGYGGDRPLNCHMEERISYEDVCVPWQEELCYTQSREECKQVPSRNCTANVVTNVDRKCFDVTEMLCSLKQNINYEGIQEKYQVQKCTTLQDRVCDTIYNVDVVTEDDYQCCDVESTVCTDKEFVVMDAVCKHTYVFDCKKVKRGDGGYAKEKVCTKEPKENCYETPRTVRQEVCKPLKQRHCEKFTNQVPRPVEDQNCHFESKKKCELKDMTRPRKAKQYSYTKECKDVQRTLCDDSERNYIDVQCSDEYRHKCEYIPTTKCEKFERQYCYKEEHIEMEEVCDKKLDHAYL